MKQYTGQPGVMLADTTDPWLQRPDGAVVDLEPFTALLSPGPCGEDCSAGIFAPTGNGPTEQGIERCDQCATYEGDLDAALALAVIVAHVVPGVTVWYQPEED